MKRTLFARLLSGTLVLALATSLVACSKTEVKPADKKVFPNGPPPALSPTDDHQPQNT